MNNTTKHSVYFICDKKFFVLWCVSLKKSVFVIVVKN